MAGLVPAIHVFIPLKSWMPGTRLVLGPAEGRSRVPGMTAEKAFAVSIVAFGSHDLSRTPKRSARGDPQYPGLSQARHYLSRHNHTAGRCACFPPCGG